MPRRARSVLPDGIFHVTTRGVAKNSIFRDELDYRTFKDMLADVRGRYAWNIHAYCLMPNHFHLVVEAAREDLSRGMHRLNFLYAQRFNRRYDRVGHVFQNRFKAYVIQSEEHFGRTLRYVAANPVKAGLCGRATDWPWFDGPTGDMY